MKPLPLVAVVGRPNVGKSTLYNRLVGGRPALVEDVPGVTRDRRYGEVEFSGRRFAIVDTGGLDPGAEEGVITAGIHRQAERAIAEAALVVFVVDGRDGLTPVDHEVARRLRRLGREVLVVANKIDGAAQETLTGEAYALGLGNVLGVSATHGRGTHDLLEAILARLGDAAVPAPEPPAPSESPEVALADRPIRLAFVGRPNAGKSSLVNRLLGEERVLVHDQPGTTTDPVDTPFEFGGQHFVLVDTAGIRRKARVEEPTEKIAVSMALGQIARADVAALVLDATEGPAEQDAKIASAIQDAGTAVVILLNKADLVAESVVRALRKKIEESLQFLSFAPVRLVSARTGQGVPEALAEVQRVFVEHGRRVPTAELNRFYADVCETHPPPTFRGKAVRIYYLTQGGAHPPTFLLFANRPELVNYGYRRFLVNQLRERFGFEGSPVRVITRGRRDKDAGKGAGRGTDGPKPKAGGSPKTSAKAKGGGRGRSPRT